jgi:putative cell wall-binding protein
MGNGNDKYGISRRTARDLLADYKLVIAIILVLCALFPIVYVGLWSNRTSASNAGPATLSNIGHVTGGSPYETSVNTSRLIYTYAKPGVAIIVRADDAGYADALAASALTHHPRNGPILFTAIDALPDSTFNEILRLNSLSGTTQMKILAIGDLSSNVTARLSQTGLPVEIIRGKDVYETAYLIDEKLGFPGTIIIASSLDGGTASCAAAWSAHFGTPMLIVENDTVPEPTLRAINHTYHPEIYIIGNENAVSRAVEEKLRSLNVKSVDRIGGATPSDVSVNLASYRKGLFGWGKMSDAANAFSVVRTNEWRDAISGALLAHLDRHMPILFTDPGSLDPAVSAYLDSINQPDTPVPDYAIIVGKGLNQSVEESLSAIMAGHKSGMEMHGM